VLIDESGFMLQPLVRRTWAPRGQTPVLNAWDRHDRLTAITALVLSPKRRRCSLYFQLLDHNARFDDFVWFLVQLRKETRRRLLVVWDRLGGHRKAERILRLLGCEWLEFEYLPAYCPELNPVEHVWCTTKWGRLANWPAPGVEALRARVTADLTKQASQRQLLQQHFRWSGLDLS
jgi:transposase